MLRKRFKRLRKDAAAGIDKMTRDMYAENLDADLSDLMKRLSRQGVSAMRGDVFPVRKPARSGRGKTGATVFRSQE